MANKPQLLYWDSCVFLSYIDEEVGRVDVIEAIFAEVQKSNGSRKIVTSIASMTEVAYSSQEKSRRILDAATLSKIDHLWGDPSVLVFVEYHEGIARIARNLMREAVSKQYKLTPLDAIHLASAKWLSVHEFQTYDHGLKKYTTMISCTICEPYVAQLQLPGI